MSARTRKRRWRNQRRPDRKRWEALREDILARDDCTCQNCGFANDGYGLEVDHIVPLSDCTDDQVYDPANLQTLCRDCHLRKTAEEMRDPTLSWSELFEREGISK